MNKRKCPNCNKQRENEAFRAEQPICVYCEQLLHIKAQRRILIEKRSKNDFTNKIETTIKVWNVPKGRPRFYINDKDMHRLYQYGGDLDLVMKHFYRQRGRCSSCRKILTEGHINFSRGAKIVKSIYCTDCSERLAHFVVMSCLSSKKKWIPLSTVEQLWQKGDLLMRTLFKNNPTFVSEMEKAKLSA